MNLFITLRRHSRLAEKRNPMYEKSRFAKFWIHLMVAFWAGYLLLFGTLFAFAFQGGAIEAYHMLDKGLPVILFIDFLLRLPFQKTPVQEIKPYILLPVPRRRLTDCLLLRSGLDSYNLFWFFFFAPFALFTITRFYGLAGVIGYLAGIWLLMVMNGYWYLLCRTLMGERFLWLLLPVLVYAGLGAWLFLPEESTLMDFSLQAGEGFIHGSVTTFAAVILVIVLLYLANRQLIGRLMYNELNKIETTTVEVKHLSQYRFLDRYGQVGEYIKLELKLMLRNTVCRRGLYMGGGVVLMFSLLLSFTDVYGSGMTDFLVMYNFTLFGILFLSTIMGYEGNYIDGLMSRKESIYSLLQAKYIVYSTGQVIPLLLMLPALIIGKVEVLICLSWFFFVPGFVYFLLFQTAVYNNRTVDLNKKLTQRNAGTGMQNLIAMAVFIIPLLLFHLLAAFMERTHVAWTFILIGAGFAATSRLWLRNVYRRFMKRRYLNMEGFRDSRQK